MGFTHEYREQVEQKLARVANIRSRPMFGGVGIYSDELFFALIAEDKLYFKVGDTNREDFERAGMEPFFPYDAPTPMSYYELPEKILNKPKELTVWIEKALTVAASKRKSTKTTARRKKG